MAMRKCGSCNGLSPMSESECVHCGEIVAVRKVTGKVVALVAVASVTVSACFNPVAIYGAPACDTPLDDGGVPEYCREPVDAGADAGSDGGTDGGP